MSSNTPLNDEQEADIVSANLAAMAIKLEATAKLKAEYKELAIQGLWKNNPGLVQLLGLCPLLAVTSTFTNFLFQIIANALVV